MKLTNQQIILIAQAINGFVYSDQSDLNAIKKFAVELERLIDFGFDNGHHADNVVSEMLNSLEVQQCWINTEREEEERKLAEYEYELEPDDDDEEDED